VENANISGFIDGTATHGYTTPAVDVSLTVTGVNDAPVVYTVTGMAAAGKGFVESGATWTDVDNAAGTTVTVEYEHGGNTAAAYNDGVTSFDHRIDGDFGALLYDEDTGAYRYTLHADAFDTDSGVDLQRVSDTFTVKVSDEGHLGGDEATGQTDLILYGVSGEQYSLTGGDDNLEVAAGLSHFIIGGAGNDTIDLSGSGGMNVLVWQGGDEGTGELPAIDTILDFNVGTSPESGDALDIRSLLDSAIGTSGKTAKDLVSFEVKEDDTIINIGSADDPSTPVQQIVLDHVTLATDQGQDLAALAQQILLNTQ
jgi:VCBS repeat-containing protein